MSQCSECGRREPLRVFARVRTFECACVSCGRLVKIHMARTVLREGARVSVPREAATGAKRYFRRLPAATWDYRTSRFCCPGCRAVYIVGLAFWGVAEGRTRRVPPDTIPSAEQSRELAKLDEEWDATTGKKLAEKRAAGARVKGLAGATVAEGHHSAYFGAKQWGEAVNVVVEGGEDDAEKSED